jgi:Holliday junction resolvasome RuvABC DNA-binding subunit
MPFPPDSEPYKLFLKLESQVKAMRKIIIGELNQEKQAAVEVLTQLEFSTKEATAAVEQIPDGPDAATIVQEVLRRAYNK